MFKILQSPFKGSSSSSILRTANKEGERLIDFGRLVTNEKITLNFFLRDKRGIL